MKFSYAKLNSAGIAHYIIPLLAVVAVAIGGVYTLVSSHAATPDIGQVSVKAYQQNASYLSSFRVSYDAGGLVDLDTKDVRVNCADTDRYIFVSQEGAKSTVSNTAAKFKISKKSAQSFQRLVTKEWKTGCRVARSNADLYVKSEDKYGGSCRGSGHSIGIMYHESANLGTKRTARCTKGRYTFFMRGQTEIKTITNPQQKTALYDATVDIGTNSRQTITLGSTIR